MIPATADNDSMTLPQQCQATLRLPDGQLVRCMRYGPCILDNHLGQRRLSNGRVDLVKWGRDAELYQEEFGSGSYPVIPAQWITDTKRGVKT